MRTAAAPAGVGRLSGIAAAIGDVIHCVLLPVALVGLAPPAARAEAACRFEVQSEGRVAEILDARTFRLADGREVRLAGVETATSDPGSGNLAGGVVALQNLIAGRDVTLRAAAATKPDRYGRLVSFVFPGGFETSVQDTLLEQGHLFAAGSIADAACANDLRAREAVARTAGLGVWAAPTALKNAEMPDDILTRVGQFAVIEGTVLSVREAGATLYINFGRRWTRDFAVTISRRMVRSFEAAGITPKTLANRRIRVRGWVERRGGPRVQAFAPGQLEMIDESLNATSEHKPRRPIEAGPGRAELKLR